jgi:GH25 family lysozyme M1 (1,4-beta-N-acetylmuramidase)
VSGATGIEIIDNGDTIDAISPISRKILLTNIQGIDLNRWDFRSPSLSWYTHLAG